MADLQFFPPVRLGGTARLASLRGLGLGLGLAAPCLLCLLRLVYALLSTYLALSASFCTAFALEVEDFE